MTESIGPAPAIADARSHPASPAHQALGLTDVLLFTMAMIWGINFVVVKYATHIFSPVAFTGLRVVTVAIFLLLVVSTRGGIRLPRADVIRLLLLGVLGNGLYQLFFVHGVARTLVLDTPRRARALFEALVADNIGIGRPAAVSVLFARRVQRNTQSIFRTRVFTQGTQVRIDFTYKHCRVKLYLKEGCALRIELVVNDPGDLDLLKGLAHLPQVQRTARQINARVLTMLRVGQSCAIENALFEGVSRPYVRDGQRTAALRFGDSRVMALAGALCLTVHAIAGFNNRSLRALVGELLGTTYTSAQMTYDLRRLRLHGLIARTPASNTYFLTPQGIRVALFYTKVHDRLLTPLLGADKPPAPLPLRRALHTIDQHVDSYIDHARLRLAA